MRQMYSSEKRVSGRSVHVLFPSVDDVDLTCVLWFVCFSRPEDRGHQEEAAAVHRAVQVAAQLAESLVRLRHASVGRPHQPGQRSNTPRLLLKKLQDIFHLSADSSHCASFIEDVYPNESLSVSC